MERLAARHPDEPVLLTLREAAERLRCFDRWQGIWRMHQRGVGLRAKARQLGLHRETVR